MPDCEWLTSTVPLRRRASSDKAGTVGFGVGSASIQSGTICFQNSACASNGNCIPAKTFGYSGPNLKMVHASSCDTDDTGGSCSATALPLLTRLMSAGLDADRPRDAWSMT